MVIFSMKIRAFLTGKMGRAHITTGRTGPIGERSRQMVQRREAYTQQWDETGYVKTMKAMKAILRFIPSTQDPWGYQIGVIQGKCERKNTLTTVFHRMDILRYIQIIGVKKLDGADGAIEVYFGNGKNIRFEDCWLRDHCRCSSCYHADKFQRAKHLQEIPEAKLNQVLVENSELLIKWSDNHESTYAAEFLIQFDYKTWKSSRRLNHILWRGPNVAEKIARVNVNEFLNTEKGSRKVFQSLLEYGVSLIEGVEATVEATEEVCQALGGVQHTLFGGMWRFTNIAEHADTAYTNLPLAVHNDNTYFTESAGLQVLHCVEHLNPVGGETVLVDGFYGAQQLKEDCPECYDFLTMFDVEAEYIEDGHHHTYSAPVIVVDKKTEDVKQIRFNVYDRSPMAFNRPDECRSYYRSLRKLGQYYENPDNQWQFKLSPGTVMVMDNFRVLHGRTGFSGQRVLSGSYVSRSDWLDKARCLGLIN